MGRFFGMVSAVVMHVGFILFGGWLFLGDEQDQGTLREVELLTEAEATPEKEPEQPVAEEREDLETEVEEAPDAAEIMRNLELSASPALEPALEAASLGAIEAALNGQGVGGDFADVLTFASGGRIGGLGAPGSTLEDALEMGEIDQEPQVIFQAAPAYPSELRKKKLEGVVTLIFVVDATGRVNSPRVEESTHPAFERPALDAIKQWKFEPGVKGGQRVNRKMRLSIRFQPNQS